MVDTDKHFIISNELYANIGIVPERYLLLIAHRIYLYQTDHTIPYTDTELV